jgi:rubrerythrin
LSIRGTSRRTETIEVVSPANCGDAVLILHCPKCDAIFEAHDDAHFETTCPRCGRVVRTGATISWFAANADRRGAKERDDQAHLSGAEDSRESRFSLAGRPGILRWTKNVAVRLIASVCPACGHTVRRGMTACPLCGRSLIKQAAPRLPELGRVLRKVLLRTAVFIGLPAAVIVFVLIVCAPEGGDLGQNAPRSTPAGSARERTAAAATAQQNNPNEAVVKRGPLSALRSFRKWLRGPERGSSPARAPLSEAPDRAGKADVPPEAAGNGDHVKPDPAP